MSIWDSYNNRIEVHGGTKRNSVLAREQRAIWNKMKDSLSFHNVLVDGEERKVSIINSDNLNEKLMYSMPGEDFDCGGYVEWADNHWIIEEKDANNEVYTKVKLLQCNYLLRWVDDDHKIHEQWCMIEDGTKYLTGEYEDRKFIVTRGDSRIAMIIGRNPYTAKFGRESRFLIDDPASGEMLAYALTKPLKVGHVYNDKGIYSFVLQEIVATDDDNFELCIADYYKHFPKNDSESDIINTDDNNTSEANGKKVWL